MKHTFYLSGKPAMINKKVNETRSGYRCFRQKLRFRQDSNNFFPQGPEASFPQLWHTPWQYCSLHHHGICHWFVLRKFLVKNPLVIHPPGGGFRQQIQSGLAPELSYRGDRFLCKGAIVVDSAEKCRLTAFKQSVLDHAPQVLYIHNSTWQITL